MIDQTFTIETLQKLVQINSVNPGLDKTGPGEEEIGTYIFNLLKELHIEAELDEVAPGRVNVTGRIKGDNGGKTLMLNAHMDTVGVSGMDDPFSGRVENGKLYGRGAYDMKGSIAAILAASKAIQDNRINFGGDLILSFVADEEHESIGAQALVKKLKPDAAIVTEPTDLKLCLAHRGFGIYKITTLGKTAHGGNHMLGTDANLNMGLLLAELSKLSHQLPQLKNHALCGEASMHVPLIKGGRSLFIYSHECTIHVERRTLPGETQQMIESELFEIIRRVQQANPDFKAEMEPVIWRSPYEVDPQSPVVVHLKEASDSVLGNPPLTIGHTWWEDSAIFGEAGIECAIMGPKGRGIHEDIEWVETESVVQLAEVLYRTAERFCR